MLAMLMLMLMMLALALERCHCQQSPGVAHAGQHVLPTPCTQNSVTTVLQHDPHTIIIITIPSIQSMQAGKRSADGSPVPRCSCTRVASQHQRLQLWQRSGQRCNRGNGGKLIVAKVK